MVGSSGRLECAVVRRGWDSEVVVGTSSRLVVTAMGVAMRLQRVGGNKLHFIFFEYMPFSYYWHFSCKLSHQILRKRLLNWSFWKKRSYTHHLTTIQPFKIFESISRRDSCPIRIHLPEYVQQTSTWKNIFAGLFLFSSSTKPHTQKVLTAILSHLFNKTNGVKNQQ